MSNAGLFTAMQQSFVMAAGTTLLTLAIAIPVADPPLGSRASGAPGTMPSVDKDLTPLEGIACWASAPRELVDDPYREFFLTSFSVDSASLAPFPSFAAPL